MVLDRFLVCGLGSLGQHCVVALHEFGVKVIAIERQLTPEPDWEIAQVPNFLEKLMKLDAKYQNSNRIRNIGLIFIKK